MGYEGMGKKYNSQAGFGALGVLVAVVAVLVIGGSGYLVYRAHHKNSATSDSTTATSSATPVATTSTTMGTAATVTQQGSYLDIKEAGVKFLLGSSVTDTTYAPYYSPSSDGATVFGLSSQAITSAGSNAVACSASHGTLGIIRVTTSAPTELAPPNGNKVMTPDNKTLFEIGGKYYQYIAPQNAATCGTVSPAQVEADQQVVAQSFTSLESDSAN